MPVGGGLCKRNSSLINRFLWSVPKHGHWATENTIMSENKQIAQLYSTIWTLCLLKVGFEPQILPLFSSTTKCIHTYTIQWTYWIILLFLLLWRPFWNENIVNLCIWIHIYMIIVAWISQKMAFDFFCDCVFFFNEINERRHHIKTSSLQYNHEIKRMPSSLCVHVCLHRIKLISILKHFTKRISNMIHCFHVKTPSVNGQMAKWSYLAHI